MKDFCLSCLVMLLVLTTTNIVESLHEVITSLRMKYLETGEQFVGKVILRAVARSRVDCNIRYYMFSLWLKATTGGENGHFETYY